MSTLKELGLLFDSLYDVTTNKLDFPRKIEDYDAFLSGVERVHVSKTWSKVGEPRELWDNPRVNLLMSDATILYGASGPKLEVRCMNKPGEKMDFVVPTDFYEKIKNSPVLPGFIHYPHDVISEWVGDAAPLIRTGRLAYLPQRFIATSELRSDGKRHFTAHEVIQNFPFFHLFPTGENFDENIEVVSGPSTPHDAIRELVQLELPVIEHFSLTDYARLLDDERDAVTRLRGALGHLVSELATMAARSDDFLALRNGAIQIRDQVIHPEIANLNQKYRRVVGHRTLALAGTCVSSVATCASLMMGNPNVSALTLIGGAIATIREYSESKKEKQALQDSPFHFLWHIKHKAPA